jgi:hypothetical protein
MAAPVPPEAERLYGLPLDEFVGGRNELAKELRAAGRREDADRVKELRRPPPALWAVNQLGRTQEAEVGELLAAAERLRGGDRAAAEDVSRGVDRLVRRAREVLADGGHAASDATLQRVAATLRAAAGDPEHAADLQAGRLAEEVEPAGFDAMAALAGQPPPSAEPKPAKQTPRRDTTRLRKAREAVDSARKRARALGRAAETAEREASRARSEADRADAELERAEHELQRLRGGDV